jgi:CRISPR-associated endonuclease/helicase Cas3
MEDLAKPRGTTLKEHTQNVVSEAQNIITHHDIVVEKYQKITGFNLVRRLNGAATFHDAGKASPTWQKACQLDFEVYKKTGKVGNFLRNAGIRHEIESLKIHAKDKFSDCVKVAIAAHHAKLAEKFAEKVWKKQAIELWKYFQELKHNTRHESTLEELIKKNYEFAGVRSYLQLADHRASIKEDGKVVPDFIKFEYNFKHETKREVQKLVEKYWQDDLLLLRAPTGAGKTDACLLWAKKQIENKRADRLVIAMPTRFTSNALAINVTDTLSDTGLYHSSAWFTKFSDKAKESREAEDYAKLQHEFAKLLETPVTVCTIDHLLMAQTHTREAHHGITFNLANSCLVIDEADFYDEFTQGNILELLKILKTLDVPVLLMSASLPESSLDFYKLTGYNPKEIREDISDIGRPRCEIKDINTFENIEEIDLILEQALNQPTIIYANTVARAMEFYEWFKKREVKDLILYHSRFTEPDKLKKENSLIENLGREAWEKKAAKGIAILTQIGEMSVNISADFMISEVCPIDRLVQRVGRLCRFSKKIGELQLLIPQKNEILYPAPYGIFRQGKGWQPNIPLEETIKRIDKVQYSAKAFVDLINIIYKDLSNFSDVTRNNISMYKKLIVYNWLIIPEEETAEDDDKTSKWKSRNITGQSEVFVIHPSVYLRHLSKTKTDDSEYFFKNYKEFQFYKNQCAINYPTYLLKKGLENNIVHEYQISIGYDKDSKRILCCIPEAYNEKLGLTIDIKSDNFL